MTIYKIRIVYKSGYVHEQWFEKFTVIPSFDGAKEISWKTVENEPIPMLMGGSEIACVFQLEYKEVE